jgi:succinate dehydrogenase hydrophobic anchor subunit
MRGKLSDTKPARILALLLVIFAIAILSSLVHNISITATQVAYNLVTAAFMTAFLAWLVPKIHLSLWSLALVVGIELLVIEYLNNYVEAYFFTSIFESRSVAEAVVSSVFISAIVATAAALLLGHGVTGITASLKEYLSTRTRSSWVLRIAVGSVAYFPIYFFFGALISPFVLPYYSNPALGLVIPPFTVMTPLELFRGFVYTLVLLPLLATTVGGRTTRFVALASTLYIPGGLLALLGAAEAPMLPIQIIPFHGLEILADSIVYGFILSRLLSGPR